MLDFLAKALVENCYSYFSQHSEAATRKLKGGGSTFVKSGLSVTLTHDFIVIKTKCASHLTTILTFKTDV